MAILRTSQLTSTILPRSTATRTTTSSNTAAATSRATQTAAQQIQASASRDDSAIIVSNMTTAQVVASLTSTTSNVRSSSASLATTTASVTSTNLKSSSEANEILKNIVVATVTHSDTGSTSNNGNSISIPTSSDKSTSAPLRSTTADIVGTNQSTLAPVRPLDVIEAKSTASTTLRPSSVVGGKLTAAPVRPSDVITDKSTSAPVRPSDVITDKSTSAPVKPSDIIGAKSTAAPVRPSDVKHSDKLIIRTKIKDKDLTPLVHQTPIIDLAIKKKSIPAVKSVKSSIVSEKDEVSIRTLTPEATASFANPVLFSGSFAIGSDSYNLDTPLKDLRSYSGELLNSFDQLSSTFPECEIVAMIRDDRNKVIIVFRMSNFNNFQIKVFDTFYDRKVFYNGYSTTETANSFLNSPFVASMTRDDPPSDILSFTRDQAKEALIRHKETIKKYGINVDLNYSIFGTDDERIAAKKLLELGVFDYNYNPDIQDDSIFVHKIYGTDMVSAIGLAPSDVIGSGDSVIATGLAPTATVTGLAPAPTEIVTVTGLAPTATAAGLASAPIVTATGLAPTATAIGLMPRFTPVGS